MSDQRPALLLIALAALIVVASAVLAGVAADVPAWFANLAFAALAGGAGAASPQIVRGLGPSPRTAGAGDTGAPSPAPASSPAVNVTPAP